MLLVFKVGSGWGMALCIASGSRSAKQSRRGGVVWGIFPFRACIYLFQLAYWLFTLGECLAIVCIVLVATVYTIKASARMISGEHLLGEV